jgi:hypothetical protein
VSQCRQWVGSGGSTDARLPLVEKVNGLLCAEEGWRDWPLCFYDPKTLSSREARLGWVEPDLGEMP